MRTIRRVFWTFLLLLSAAWWLSDPTPMADLTHVFAWRAVLLQYTGVLGIGVMALALVLAARPVAFEPWLGGLDKMYRLHKWLGITALALSVAHWLLAVLPGHLVGLGWLRRQAYSASPLRTEMPALEWLQQTLRGQRGMAVMVGEWAFCLAVLMMLLALVRYFPYRYFFKVHRLLAAAFLALAWHAVVLMRVDYWMGALGPPLAVLVVAGSIAAVRVLLRRVAAGRKAVGEVSAITRHEALHTLELTIDIKGRWSGHRAGQFAFVTFHTREGAHPFTIASPWTGDGRISFLIKALGDYTRTLERRLHVGSVVQVEGPYGQFTFEGARTRQIWVGGGIGIAPFVARMKTLARAPDGKTIDLFHATAEYDADAIGLLERDAQAAGVHLHVLWDARDGLLDAQRIAAAVPQWREADVWFCGPAPFGQALRRDLLALGLPAEPFHHELFEMR
ncbi:MAG: ferric reductase-like transmembrane domain-containing protein [Burkholderiaceae bacterium]|nr:ferric reductase-like transmembrane domain-containing protein [Burkholderiaceae bacterium]